MRRPTILQRAAALAALLIVSCTLLSSRALAYEPPPFDASEFLYDATLARNDAHAARRSLELPGVKMWVVVDDVKDGVAFSDLAQNQTEDALEQTWHTWSSQGFDTTGACLMVVGLDDRRVQLRCGTELDRGFGLHTDRLSDITDRAFVPAIRRQDLTSAIRDTVTLLRKVHDDIEAHAPFTWPSDTIDEHVLDSIPGVWSPPVPTRVLQTGPHALRVHVVAVTRGPQAQNLADKAIKFYISQNPSQADRLAVISYVWATDTFGVAVAPEAYAWVDDVEKAKRIALAKANKPGVLDKRFSRVASSLNRPFEASRMREAMKSVAIPKPLSVQADRWVYGPPTIADQPQLESWLATLPIPVRVYLVPSLHDGSLTSNPSGAPWAEYLTRNIVTLQTPVATEPNEEGEPGTPIVITLWAEHDDAPMRFDPATPSWIGGWHSEPRLLTANMRAAWQPPEAADRWAAPGLRRSIEAVLQPALQAHQVHIEQEQKRITRQRRGNAIATIVMSLVSAIVLVIIVWIAAAPRRRRERQLRAEVEAWRMRIATARERLTDFVVTTELRDRLVDLKVRGPASQALLHAITSDLDAVEVGLRGLQRHVDDVAAVADGPFGLSRAAFTEATERLNQAFDTPPTTSDDPGLFGIVQPATLDAKSFVDSLHGRFEAARAGWDRLLHAVELAWAERRPAICDSVRVDGVIAQLDRHGLDHRWMLGHPITRPEELQLVDEAIRDDPVAYLDEVDHLAAEEARVFARIDAVLDDIISVRTAIEKARTAAAALPPTVLRASHDPERCLGEAEAAERRMLQLAQLPEGSVTIDGLKELESQIDERARDAMVACLDAIDRTKVVHASIKSCANLPTTAEQLGQLTARVTALKQEIARMAGDHELRDAWEDLSGFIVELTQVHEPLDAATLAVSEQRIVDAAEHLAEAREELEEATQSEQQMRELLLGMRQAKSAAQALIGKLEGNRTAHARTLRLLRSDPDSHLRWGDQLLASLQSTWSDGPAHWEQRLAALNQVKTSWRSSVSSEKKRVRKEELEEIRRQNTEQMLAEQRSRKAMFGQSSWSSRSSSSSSWGSSSGSSWGSSSSNSGSSSGRSGGSSFGSSGGRSGGSSFGSSGGGRSGGSSW